MIRINLINNKSKSQLNPQLTTIAISAEVVLTKQELQKQGILRLMALFFFPLLLYFFDNYYYQEEVKSQFPTLQAEINKLVEFNKSKEKFVEDIKQFEKEGKIIQEKIDKINFLNALRGHEIEVHKFFQKSLPEKLWIDDFTYSYDTSKTDNSAVGEIKVRGLSYNASDVQRLRNEIKQNILFNSCEILEQKTVDFEGQKVESFEMKISMGK
ncbi:MAG: PilN domain-containing protein [Bdellovibrionaceae bacterium]|nr:PilN domain-containing protein [Pseudobdellovibrionaceae bacterium]NUM57049.1 hypothetical protein [Pseudobdellovibrionaceae bacterium]